MLIEQKDKYLVITRADGRQASYPYIYLRDNCPAIRHANGQKLTETVQLSLGVRPETIQHSPEEGIHIKWNDGHESFYPDSWLQTHDLSQDAVGARRSQGDKFSLWDAAILPPASSYNDITSDSASLAQWLGYVQRYGFAVLHDVPAEENMVLEVIKLFGFTRETNYGKLFDVRTVINPNNLAFTNLGISPHTDNPYRDPAPTLQLLHCLQSSASGGDTVLVDGRNMAALLKKDYPRFYDLLTTVMVTFRFQDKHNLLEYTGPIISLYPNGDFKAIRFNNRSIQPFDLTADEAVDFYEAYMTLAAMLDDPQYQVQFRMNAGDLYIVDNERVLHARSAYDDTQGERWLQGAYADRDGLLSKWKTGAALAIFQ